MDKTIPKRPFQKFIAFVLAAILLAALPMCRPVDQKQAANDRIPQRVISLSPSYTEILFAVGLGSRLVAVSDFCIYPEEARKLPKVGGVLNPNLERALSFKPDLVIFMKTQTELIERYRSLGIRSLPLLTDRIDDLYQGIREIGRVFDVRAESEKLVTDIKEDLARVERKVAGSDRPRTLLIAGHQPGDLREIYIAGPTSFMGEVLRTAGGKNVFDDLAAPWSNVSVERILEKDPEVVIVTSIKKTITEEDKTAERSLWSPLTSLAAVKNGRIHLLPADPVTVPGPRLGESALLLSTLIHPEKEDK